MQWKEIVQKNVMQLVLFFFSSRKLQHFQPEFSGSSSIFVHRTRFLNIISDCHTFLYASAIACIIHIENIVKRQKHLVAMTTISRHFKALYHFIYFLLSQTLLYMLFIPNDVTEMNIV